ncbi:Arginyl-tRNA synthetase [Favolaschia claudopus]|uniref:Arginyl-tRNA synthetase n=1 Tax=Favolaschia claudopus TaxID=2862362 RepID=A0AAW0EIJ2_9AGAR
MSSSQLLPSVLPSRPAVTDVATTPEDLIAAQRRARVTSPKECRIYMFIAELAHLTYFRTPLFICAFTGCNRLFPSRDRLMTHRKRDHQNSEETDRIITWNE